MSGRRPHAVQFREAVGWSIFYIAVAVGFGVALGVISGWQFGAQYFAGYIVEKSLSVDNLFVFLVIMTTFAVPAEHQQRVLTFGILLALGPARRSSSRSAPRCSPRSASCSSSSGCC